MKTSTPAKRTRKSTAFSKAVAAISADIVSGAYPPESLLPPERELETRYGVSRTTIRKCLKSLVDDATLICRPRVGYIVKQSRQKPPRTSSAVVAVIHRDFSGIAYYQPMISAMENLFSNSGYSLTLESSGRNSEKENLCIQRCVKNKVEALVVIPANSGTRSTELERWIRDKKPIVLRGHPGNWLLPDELAEECDQVDSDNFGGISEAYQYLNSLGHCNIAYISSQSGKTSERHKAFVRILEDKQIQIPDSWLLDDLPMDIEGGEKALARLLEFEPPTAVICATDVQALDFIHAMKRKGLRCPEDISVMGFGKQFIRTLEPTPTLTTIAEAHEVIAMEQHRLIIKQLQGKAEKPERVRVPVHLDIGQTTCPPRTHAI